MTSEAHKQLVKPLSQTCDHIWRASVRSEQKCACVHTVRCCLYISVWEHFLRPSVSLILLCSIMIPLKTLSTRLSSSFCQFASNFDKLSYISFGGACERKTFDSSGSTVPCTTSTLLRSLQLCWPPQAAFHHLLCCFFFLFFFFFPPCSPESHQKKCSDGKRLQCERTSDKETPPFDVLIVESRWRDAHPQKICGFQQDRLHHRFLVRLLPQRLFSALLHFHCQPNTHMLSPCSHQKSSLCHAAITA